MEIIILTLIGIEIAVEAMWITSCDDDKITFEMKVVY